MTHKAILDIFILHVAPYDRHLAHIDYLEEFLLIASRFWHAECGLHIALKAQSLGDAIGSNRKSAIYLWWELPTEH